MDNILSVLAIVSGSSAIGFVLGTIIASGKIEDLEVLLARSSKSIEQNITEEQSEENLSLCGSRWSVRPSD